MKIGIAQINTTVGDLTGNKLKIINAYNQLVSDGAQLVIFPELVVTGYPPRDLLFKSKFVSDNKTTLDEIVAKISSVPAVIGFIEKNDSREGRPFFNSAAWCINGKIETIGRKCLLPTYDVFDEDRYFEAAREPTIIEYGNKKFGITICEDIWTQTELPHSERYSFDPVEYLSNKNIDFLLNLSASPWHYGKYSMREELVQSAAKKCNCPVIYCNAVGGNDELIFDGHSVVTNSKGEVIAGVTGFSEDLILVDTEDTSPVISPKFQQDELADIYDALVLGLRDYAQKCGFNKVLLGLSGGIDSAVTVVLAVEAFGKENVIGVSLPSSISSDHSRSDAKILANNLEIEFHTIPISDVVASATQTLAPIFEGLKKDVTEENLQARSRGVLLMAMSNKFNALLLTTGNKSELAVGYCTLYGDMCGGLAVISDLPKIKVYNLARWINRDNEVIPWNTIDKPPSAELRPDQKDEDSLPPYEILDEILRLYIEEGKSSREIIDHGFEEIIVRDIVRKVDLNEYKRKQAAPGLKITPLAFGVGRRIPIVQKYVS